MMNTTATPFTAATALRLIEVFKKLAAAQQASPDCTCAMCIAFRVESLAYLEAISRHRNPLSKQLPESPVELE